MGMFNTILVAVDESEAAREACDLACKVALEDHATLLLVSVFDVTNIIAASGYDADYRPRNDRDHARSAARVTQREEGCRGNERPHGQDKRRRRRRGRRDLATCRMRTRSDSFASGRTDVRVSRDCSSAALPKASCAVRKFRCSSCVNVSSEAASKGAGKRPPRSRASSHATMRGAALSVAVRICGACHARVRIGIGQQPVCCRDDRGAVVSHQLERPGLQTLGPFGFFAHD